ncbi:hypothetical protein [Mucilaginibacter kameinonensis]|uniref:hypothetical protein n=1 Tax=Mucilaginibacter kameinonensis TaxID=452286 RepID=UPI000EF7F961|nr:hypothetical protein [Mucilaginibacter kameinonensis]
MDIHDLPYRLKSARRKKRLIKEAFDKKLIQLNKLQDKLNTEKKALPWIPLEKPYQKGWKREFVLTAKEKRGPKADFFEGLLSKINFPVYHYDETFQVKKKRRMTYEYLNQPQFLRDFSPYNWRLNKMLLTDEEKALFERKEIWHEQYREWAVRFVFTEPWRFELAIKPHFIYLVKLGDELLEQQIGEVHNRLRRDNLWPYINRIKRGNTYKYWKVIFSEQPKYINEFKNNPKYASKEAYLDY